ncbi:hypothetical protein C8R42DRAFT_728021 [Lentinula raphanica]|nr:hypothetical protein C8R42DRAFT_728021 [Lentinula raphanica]
MGTRWVLKQFPVTSRLDLGLDLGSDSGSGLCLSSPTVGLTSKSTWGVARATELTGYLDGSIVSPSPLQASTASTQMSSAPDLMSTTTTMSSEPSTTSLAAHSAPTLINSCALSVKEWEQHNRCLAGIIYQNIKDPCFLGVTEVMTAHQMWVHLTSEYDSTSSAATQAFAEEHIQ